MVVPRAAHGVAKFKPIDSYKIKTKSRTVPESESKSNLEGTAVTSMDDGKRFLLIKRLSEGGPPIPPQVLSLAYLLCCTYSVLLLLQPYHRLSSWSASSELTD